MCSQKKPLQALRAGIYRRRRPGDACAHAGTVLTAESERTWKTARETYRQEWEINQSISPGWHWRASLWVASVGFGLLLSNNSKESMAQSIQNNDPIAFCTNFSGVIVPPSGMRLKRNNLNAGPVVNSFSGGGQVGRGARGSCRHCQLHRLYFGRRNLRETLPINLLK